jgi:hypothetical protein
VDVTVDAHEAHQLADDIRHNADAVPARASLVVRKVGFDMQATAQVNAPVDTGFLKSSISIDVDSDGMGFELGPEAEYGAAVELGVPHPVTITGRDGGFLRFVVDGRVVYTRSVTLPPRAPQPYLGPAFDVQEPLLERALGAIGGQAVDRAI